jgi:hypothetical protein
MGNIELGRAGRVACVFAFGLWGCDDAKSAAKHGQGEAEHLRISASAVTIGFQVGKLRQTVSVDGFDITPLPVTATQYDACLKAGACPIAKDASADPASDEATDPDVATVERITSGISVDGAQAFCKWVGGTLPTLPQWLLAARGSVPHRFAWGDHLPSCDEHPDGVNLAAFRTRSGDDAAANRVAAAASYQPCGSSASVRFAIDQHPAGTSSKGLKDVLLAPAELLAKDPASIFGSCRGKTGFCEVFGSSPGAIDFVREAKPAEAVAAEAAKSPSSSVFAFRCVWHEGGTP